jgi:glycopeptide antibiotics resistance protein
LSPISPIRGLDLSEELNATGFGWVTYTQLESFANVALFVPFGLLISLLVPTRWWWLVVVGLAVAAAGIELGQALFLPGRVASIDDVVANTTGGVLGVLIAAGIRAIVWATRRARRTE